MLWGICLDISQEYTEKLVLTYKIGWICGIVLDIILFRIIARKILDIYPKSGSYPEIFCIIVGY